MSVLIRFFVWFIICASFSILSACNSFETDGYTLAPMKEYTFDYKVQPSGQFFGEKTIIPLQVKGDYFNSVADWYDNQTILYITNGTQGSKIYRYNIFNGESELFYETKDQIITLQANPSRRYFVVHTAVTSYEANLVLLDHKGKEALKWGVGSIELQFVWNPFNEHELFVTSFLDDWSFETYVLSVQTKTVTNPEVNQPFIQWVDTTKVAYLKWDEENTSFNAPLYVYDLESGKEEKMIDQILAFQSFKDILLTVTSAQMKSIYQLYDQKSLKVIQEFTLPMINTFSDRWWVPNFDYHSGSKQLYLFKPTAIGSEPESLSFIQFSTETGEGTQLLKNTENRPISISPDGELCLIGFQFEEILDIKNRTVHFFVKQSF
ncbi:hypothetical protein ACFSCX_08160 [Bacillus salitolerans]|uniref:YqgU-like 6-bladed beta-propeller domain-containing protein n=1 Tax=Bacillus salitolerans TaxID=1437434 RepID=A0ABW4LN63_9BACI